MEMYSPLEKGVHGGQYATLVSTKYPRAGHQNLSPKTWLVEKKTSPHGGFHVDLPLESAKKYQENIRKQIQDITGETIYVEYLSSKLS